MIIRSIKLTNFRSHESFTLDCAEKTTTIMGRNGCGKTSVLEAIFEVLQGKSFRAVDAEMVRRGANFYRVELDYFDGRKVVCVYDGVKKEFLVEDKKIRRLTKNYKYPIVLFEPDDLHLVGASPTSKRNYFDKVFGQMDELYSVNLARYNKALRQRNELLKTENLAVENLFSWDVMLAQYGVKVVEKRCEIVEKINERITETYRAIAENFDEVRIDYKSEITTESEFLRELSRRAERDILMGHTEYGAQRDSYNFVFNGKKADGSASRGEVRSLILALKFIEAEMLAKEMQKKPVVLLDDVFSELDEARQRCVTKNFQENQVILTSVGAGEIAIS